MVHYIWKMLVAYPEIVKAQSSEPSTVRPWLFRPLCRLRPARGQFWVSAAQRQREREREREREWGRERQREMPRTTAVECPGCPPLRALSFDILGLVKGMDFFALNSIVRPISSSVLCNLSSYGLCYFFVVFSGSF